MSAQKNYYVTTSIPYINGEPHLGHAMEFVMGDVLARSARSSKNYHKVIFSIGTDEHGGKVAEKAAELGLAPKALADKMSDSFRRLAEQLQLSNDRFIRTTDPGHEQRAGLIWQALKDYIYKATYEGWYCTGCEAFVTDATAKEHNGVCPNHDKPYERLSEDNYFFKLTHFAEQIKKAIDSGEFQVIPQTKKNEILGTLHEGLEDISISRPKEKISWGIPVPGDNTQVMYVWFEALMNYVTVLGYPEHSDFKEFWPANVQIVGKDIARFHAIIWPAILMGLEIALPNKLYIHGFINMSDGQKMSKSLGNVVSPDDIIGKYGVDAFRYYFLRHIPSYSDGEFSWERLEEVYNNELANELGNAVSRTSAMIIKYQQGIIGDMPPSEHDIAAYEKAMEHCRFDRALETVWQQVRGLNQYIEEEKPWALAKNHDGDHLREVLAYMASCLIEIAELLEPFMPTTSQKIVHIFGTGVVQKIETTLFPKEESSVPTSEEVATA